MANIFTTASIFMMPQNMTEVEQLRWDLWEAHVEQDALRDGNMALLRQCSIYEQSLEYKADQLEEARYMLEILRCEDNPNANG